MVYIDGFNLYYGLKEKGWSCYYWLDVRKLAATFLHDGETMVDIKYFTSRIINDQDKVQRQTTYLEAMETIYGTFIIYGQYRYTKRKCGLCLQTDEYVPTEKMTDVNIATEMLCDAHADCFDRAILVSGDSDLTSPVKAIRRLFPNKEVVVGFPPKRYVNELRHASNDHFNITKDMLKVSLLPPTVTKPDGFILMQPSRWK